MQKHATSTDLTQGSIFKLLIVFSLPILAGQMLQTLYNSVDSIVVGNFVGTTALAAVSSCGDISQMLVGFFTGLSVGAGVLFSRYFGARDYKSLHDAIHTAVTFSIILGVIMAAVGIAVTPFLLAATNCPDDVLHEATVYMRIYLGGMLFTSIYNVGSGILQAVGDSRHPFIYLSVASLTNIVLDIAFVVYFNMGVAGVAIATVMAQGLSVILVFRNMLKTDDVYKLVIKDMKVDKAILLEILDLGLPAAIQSSINALAHIFTQRYINIFGAAGMAGFGAAKKIDRYAGIAINATALGLTTFISQNMGAGKPERAFKGIRMAIVICFVYMAAICIPIYYNAETVLRLFTSDPAALDFGRRMLNILLPAYGAQMVNMIFANATRGFGKSRAVMVLNILGMVVLRQLYMFIFVPIYTTPETIIWGVPIGWSLAGSFCFIYYLVKVRLPYIREKKVYAR